MIKKPTKTMINKKFLETLTAFMRSVFEEDIKNFKTEGNMARTRLRKADRIKQAGKGCNTAQYGFGKPKEGKTFKSHPQEDPASIQKWAAAHARKRGVNAK